MGEAARRRDNADIVSVLIPERGRPVELDRLIRSLLDGLWGDAKIEILVGIDDDDPAWEELDPVPHPNVRYIRGPRPETLGVKLNDLAKEARGGILWFLANDQIVETPDWPAKCRAAVAAMPNGIGVAFPRDPLHPGHASYPILSRKMCDAVGFYAPAIFPYWFVDTHWTEIGTMMGLLTGVDIQIGSPEGRGKSHGMIDLGFWVDVFDGLRPVRVRDSVNLLALAYPGDAAKQGLEHLDARANLCARRFMHMREPAIQAEWNAKAASPPGPHYETIKQEAAFILAEVRKQMPRRLKVILCIPSTDTWKATTASCVAGLMAYSSMSGIEMGLLNVQSSDVAHGRNQSVRLALEQNPDYIMWIDSDLEFKPDTLLRLLKHGKDIVGATYNRRTPPHQTLGRLKGEQPASMNETLYEAQLLPGGFVLVKADVYRRLGHPWYYFAFAFPGADRLAAFKNLMRSYFAEIPGDDVLETLDGTAFGDWIARNYRVAAGGDFDSFSEDLMFCRRATNAGYRLWMDMSITHELVHLGELKVTCLPPAAEAREVAAKPAMAFEVANRG